MNCPKCGCEHDDGTETCPGCMASLRFARRAGSALFIPLRKEFFEAFAEGRKQWEYRRHGTRWNAETCSIGRRVVLSLGYGKHRRLTGRVADFMIVHHPDCLPGWLARYGTDAGHAACIRVEIDPSPNAPGSATEGRK